MGNNIEPSNEPGMSQVKFKHTISNFLKADFHKFYLLHP